MTSYLKMATKKQKSFKKIKPSLLQIEEIEAKINKIKNLPWCLSFKRLEKLINLALLKKYGKDFSILQNKYTSERLFTLGLLAFVTMLQRGAYLKKHCETNKKKNRVNFMYLDLYFDLTLNDIFLALLDLNCRENLQELTRDNILLVNNIAHILKYEGYKQDQILRFISHNKKSINLTLQQKICCTDFYFNYRFSKQKKEEEKILPFIWDQDLDEVVLAQKKNRRNNRLKLGQQNSLDTIQFLEKFFIFEFLKKNSFSFEKGISFLETYNKYWGFVKANSLVSSDQILEYNKFGRPFIQGVNLMYKKKLTIVFNEKTKKKEFKQIF